MFSIIKNIIVIVGLLLVAGLGYYLFINKDSLGLEATPVDMKAEAQSEDFLRQIDTLKKININTELFSDPRFTRLQSFATPVPVLPIGRSNPFSSRGR